MDYIKYIRSMVGHEKIILNAAGGIIVKDGKMLLQKRTDNDKWGCFGGMMEIGETYHSCAIREIKEETGLDVNIDYLIGIYPNYHMEYPNGDKAQVMCAVFKMSVLEKDGEEAIPVSTDGESKEIRWFAFDEIPEIYAEDHRKGIEDFLAGKQNQIY